MFVKGQLLLINHDHPHHGGKTGIFQFMGGPDADVVVMIDEKDINARFKSYLCVSKEDVSTRIDRILEHIPPGCAYLPPICSEERL